MQLFQSNNRSRRGVALLMVLFIIMAIAVVSAGFIARSDFELQAGKKKDEISLNNGSLVDLLA